MNKIPILESDQPEGQPLVGIWLVRMKGTNLYLATGWRSSVFSDIHTPNVYSTQKNANLAAKGCLKSQSVRSQLGYPKVSFDELLQKIELVYMELKEADSIPVKTKS